MVDGNSEWGSALFRWSSRPAIKAIAQNDRLAVLPPSCSAAPKGTTSMAISLLSSGEVDENEGQEASGLPPKG